MTVNHQMEEVIQLKKRIILSLQLRSHLQDHILLFPPLRYTNSVAVHLRCIDFLLYKSNISVQKLVDTGHGHHLDGG